MSQEQFQAIMPIICADLVAAICHSRCYIEYRLNSSCTCKCLSYCNDKIGKLDKFN